MIQRHYLCVGAALFVSLSVACGGGAGPAGGAAPGGRGGAMPAMPVMVEVAKSQPVEDTAAFVASIQSRESTVISPQVTGILRSIFVRSGDRVTEGKPLMQIDDALQRAQVANLTNSRASLSATLSFDKTQLDRFQKLFDEKIGTQQDFQQAQSTYNAAEAQASSLDAQIAQAKTSLSYYRVDAPRAGVVGDIPVKVGDLVTTSTMLTTLDAGGGLEVYVQVPTEQASKLKVGLPLAVLDSNGKVVAQSTIFFVSPQVDYQTQTILAKAAVPGAADARLRNQQYVQARITWGTHLAISVPVLSVVRQGASAFVDVAQPQGQGYVVHQQEVTLGAISGNVYAVDSGIAPGTKVIVSTTQILAEGMPVQPMDAAARGRRGANSGGRGR
ncbi:MAG TPA: efflux RND transporter periplasmic adaptor subunit [Terriglobales bacterium]|nr:efflux RND transporter periplasmic adaptor subunit [Terriglobales bacterium]